MPRFIVSGRARAQTLSSVIFLLRLVKCKERLLEDLEQGIDVSFFFEKNHSGFWVENGLKGRGGSRETQ